MNGSYMVRKLADSDIEATAALHLLAYPKDHFTSQFTFGMLCEFYRSILAMNDFCYVALDRDMPVGVVMVGERTYEAVQGFSKRHPLQVAAILAMNPQFIPRKILQVV